jgi:hypothetical protein
MHGGKKLAGLIVQRTRDPLQLSLQIFILLMQRTRAFPGVATMRLEWNQASGEETFRRLQPIVRSRLSRELAPQRLVMGSSHLDNAAAVHQRTP